MNLKWFFETSAAHFQLEHSNKTPSAHCLTVYRIAIDRRAKMAYFFFCCIIFSTNLWHILINQLKSRQFAKQVDGGLIDRIAKMLIN